MQQYDWEYMETLTDEQIDTLPLDMKQVEIRAFDYAVPGPYDGIVQVTHIPTGLFSEDCKGETERRAQIIAVRQLKRKLLESGWYR